MTIEYPTSGDEIRLLELWDLSFGDPDSFIRMFFRTGYDLRRCRCVRDAHRRVLAMLFWFDAEYRNQKFAYFYAIATHPDHRHKGLCRMLMENTHALLREQSYAGVLLMPGEAYLRDFYKKLGYRDQCRWDEFSCAPAGRVWLKGLTAEEYARERRKYLPENGALQEGPCLTFLGGYAKFYKGSDFLITAVRDDDKVLLLELLGNRAKAPGIVTTLGGRRSIVRTPGKSTPGAMVFPLRQDVSAPGYFGLTFD